MNNSNGKVAPTFSAFKPLTDPVVPPVSVKVEDRQPAHPAMDPVGVQRPTADDDQIKSRPQQEQRQQMSLPSVDEVKGKWKQHVGAAKIAWGKLTEDEFLQLEGQHQKLTGLVQERYAITRDEAEKQVKTFFETNKVSA